MADKDTTSAGLVTAFYEQFGTPDEAQDGIMAPDRPTNDERAP